MENPELPLYDAWHCHAFKAYPEAQRTNKGNYRALHAEGNPRVTKST